MSQEMRTEKPSCRAVAMGATCTNMEVALQQPTCFMQQMWMRLCVRTLRGSCYFLGATNGYQITTKLTQRRSLNKLGGDWVGCWCWLFLMFFSDCLCGTCIFHLSEADGVRPVSVGGAAGEQKLPGAAGCLRKKPAGNSMGCSGCSTGKWPHQKGSTAECSAGF